MDLGFDWLDTNFILIAQVSNAGLASRFKFFRVGWN